MNDSTPETITIPLTQGQVTVIDEIDADLTLFKWRAQYDPTYANGGKYVGRGEIEDANGKVSTQYIHRVILSRKLGRPLLRSELVDHEDTNPLNNRRDNLRIATNAQNAMNIGKHTDNSTGYKGVSWSKHAKKWRAQIQVDGKKKHLGYHLTAEDAYAAFCEEARKDHGKFANFG